MLRHLSIFGFCVAAILFVSKPVFAADITCIAYTYNGGVAYVYDDGSYSARSVPLTFISWAKKFTAEGHKIKSVAFSKNGGYVIIYGNNGYQYYNVPNELVSKIKDAIAKEYTIRSVAIGRSNEWVLLTDKYMYWSGNCPVSLKEKINTEALNDGTSEMVGFNSHDGYILQYRKNGRVSSWSTTLTSEQKENFVDKNKN